LTLGFVAVLGGFVAVLSGLMLWYMLLDNSVGKAIFVALAAAGSICAVVCGRGGLKNTDGQTSQRVLSRIGLVVGIVGCVVLVGFAAVWALMWMVFNQ